MAALRTLWMRPAVPTLVAIAIGLFVVFGFPISYDRTVGHDVRLTVSGEGLDEARLMSLANEMKSVLGADGVRVEADANERGEVTYELAAMVPGRSGKQARNAADALVGALLQSGLAAGAEVSARTERASGTVYAFASDRILRISTDGKSAAQIEAEIRDGLAAAGFSNAEVSVSDEGESRKVEIRAEHEGTPGSVEGEMPAIVLTKDGQELGGERNSCEVRVKKVKDEAGAEKLVIEVTKDDRTATAEVANPDAAGDLAIESAIQDQLDRAGIDARAVVSGGKISVESR